MGRRVRRKPQLCVLGCRMLLSWICSAWTWRPGPGADCTPSSQQLLFLLLALMICSFYISDLPHCSTPLGRSMFTITPTSDHTLFIYGGVGAEGNTLSESLVPLFLWDFVSLFPFPGSRNKSSVLFPVLKHNAVPALFFILPF